jgi:hypothetical protein
MSVTEVLIDSRGDAYYDFIFVGSPGNLHSDGQPV